MNLKIEEALAKELVAYIDNHSDRMIKEKDSTLNGYKIIETIHPDPKNYLWNEQRIYEIISSIVKEKRPQGLSDVFIEVVSLLEAYGFIDDVETEGEFSALDDNRRDHVEFILSRERRRYYSMYSSNILKRTNIYQIVMYVGGQPKEFVCPDFETTDEIERLSEDLKQYFGNEENNSNLYDFHPVAKRREIAGQAIQMLNLICIQFIKQFGY